MRIAAVPAKLESPSEVTLALWTDLTTELKPTPVIRRLGPRLEHLYRWATSAGHFDDVWDLCCDHGRLGLHLHLHFSDRDESDRPHVHLVDSVPAIMEKLKGRYARFIESHVAFECRDARTVEWNSCKSNLMIIAGIGGGTMVDILQSIIHKARSDRETLEGDRLEFLLSPNRCAFEVRSFLRSHNFELINEEFVTEKQWHHEHLHVRYHGNNKNVSHKKSKVSLVGDQLWEDVSEEKLGYVNMQIEHYGKRARLGGFAESATAWTEYARLLKQMKARLSKLQG